MGGMGRASTQFDKVQSERKDAARQANLLDAQMRVKLGELEHARQIGDVNSEISTMKEIAGIKHQMAQVAVQREGHGVQTRGQDITAGTATADREARARESVARNKSNEYIAGMQQAATEKRENQARFLLEMKDAQIDKLNDEINSFASTANTPDAKEKLKKLVKRRDDARDAVLKRFPGMTKNDIPVSTADAAAPAAAVATPGYKVVGPAPQK